MLDLDFKIDVPLRFEGKLPPEVIVTETHEVGRELRDRLYSQWPFVTGKSQDAWELFLEPKNFVIINDVRYTGFISTGQPVLRRNLVRAADELSERLADKLPGAILNEVSNG